VDLDDQLKELGMTAQELAVDELREAGADLSERRRIDHHLYFPTKIQADSALEDARRLGFEAAVDFDRESEDWLVIAAHQTVVTVPELTQLRERFEALCARHGGEYDGWNIAVDTEPEDEQQQPDDDWRFDPSKDYLDEAESE
jgi:regulator of RNase E activity RraB